MIRIALLAGVAALAACGPVNRSVETVKTPDLKTATLTHDVRFDGGTGLGAPEREALLQYLSSIRVGYGDRISVDDPVAAGAAARRNAVAGIVAQFGLFLEEGAPVTQGELPPGTARVVVSRSRLEVPACPDWRRGSNPELSASTMSNFGCAGRGNLAAMIADPHDLVAGRAYGGADAMTASKPVKTLRERVARPPDTLEGLSVTKGGAGK